jgi:bisanhydrobacterioruberin hydratase
LIMQRVKIWTAVIYGMFFLGIFQYGMHAQLARLSQLTPFFLGLIFLVVVFALLRESRYSFIELFTFAFFAGLFSEMIGVNTGILFGEYHYTDVLGSAILGVPIIIAFNWAFLIGGGIAIADKLFKSKKMQVLFAVFVIVVFDFIMEPVAVKLHYWEWQNNTIPIFNYVTWAGVATTCACYSQFRGIRARGTILVHYFIAQTLFFIALRIIL